MKPFSAKASASDKAGSNRQMEMLLSSSQPKLIKKASPAPKENKQAKKLKEMISVPNLWPERKYSEQPIMRPLRPDTAESHESSS